MKKNWYKVVFTNPAAADEYIYAFSKEKAEILARAEKIKLGLDDEVESITEIERETTTGA